MLHLVAGVPARDGDRDRAAHPRGVDGGYELRTGRGGDGDALAAKDVRVDVAEGGASSRAGSRGEGAAAEGEASAAFAAATVALRLPAMDSAVVKIARYVISSPEDVTTATAPGSVAANSRMTAAMPSPDGAGVALLAFGAPPWRRAQRGASVVASAPGGSSIRHAHRDDLDASARAPNPRRADARANAATPNIPSPRAQHSGARGG